MNDIRVTSVYVYVLCILVFDKTWVIISWRNFWTFWECRQKCPRNYIVCMWYGYCLESSDNWCRHHSFFQSKFRLRKNKNEFYPTSADGNFILLFDQQNFMLSFGWLHFVCGKKCIVKKLFVGGIGSNWLTINKASYKLCMYI